MKKYYVVLLFAIIFLPFQNCSNSAFQVSQSLQSAHSTLDSGATPVDNPPTQNPPIVVLPPPTSTPPVVNGSPTYNPSNSTITINGTGFGTKTRAAPLWFDNFASGTNGQPVAGRVPLINNTTGMRAWETDHRNGPAPSLSNARPRLAGKLTTYHQLTQANYASAIIVRQSMQTNNFMYLSWWHYVDVPGSWPRNTKPIEIYGSNGNVPLSYLGWGDVDDNDSSIRNSLQDVCTGSADATNVDGVVYNGSSSINGIENRWIKFEMVLVQSSVGTGGASSAPRDGQYYVTVYDPDYNNGAGRSIRFYNNSQSPNGVRTRCNSSYWDEFDFGAYGEGSDIYIDEVFMDNSPNHARIVLTNNATYLSSTFTESQPATQWSDTNISFSLNVGRFRSGDRAHVHIVRGAGGLNGYGSATYAGSIQIP